MYCPRNETAVLLMSTHANHEIPEPIKKKCTIQLVMLEGKFW